MANQDTKTKLIQCFLKKTDAAFITPKLSNPKSGGWSVFLDGTYEDGGNASKKVSLGKGADVIGKMAEVSALMKNITDKTATMRVDVDVPGTSDDLDGEIAPGDAANYHLFVAFLEQP
jgi:hypothetical protein